MELQYKTVLNSPPPAFQHTKALQLPAIYQEQPAHDPRKKLIYTQIDF